MNIISIFRATILIFSTSIISVFGIEVSSNNTQLQHKYYKYKYYKYISNIKICSSAQKNWKYKSVGTANTLRHLGIELTAQGVGGFRGNSGATAGGE